MTLDQRQLDELAEMRRKVDVLWAAQNRQQSHPLINQALALTDSVTPISAMTGGQTAGSGEVTIQKLVSGAAVNATLMDGSDMKVTVHNWTTTASATNVLVWIGQDIFGVWWYLNTACP